MPPRVSLEEVLEHMGDSFHLIQSAVHTKRWNATFSHIANTQSWLKVLRRRIQAEQKKEAQG